MRKCCLEADHESKTLRMLRYPFGQFFTLRSLTVIPEQLPTANGTSLSNGQMLIRSAVTLGGNAAPSACISLVDLDVDVVLLALKLFNMSLDFIQGSSRMSFGSSSISIDGPSDFISPQAGQSHALTEQDPDIAPWLSEPPLEREALDVRCNVLFEAENLVYTWHLLCSKSRR